MLEKKKYMCKSKKSNSWNGKFEMEWSHYFFFLFKKTYFLALSLKSRRSNTNPTIQSTLSTQIPLPNKENQGFLEKWLITSLGQEVFMLCIRHFYYARKQQSHWIFLYLKTKTYKGILTGQRWGKFEHQKEHWLKLIEINWINWICKNPCTCHDT